MPVDHSVVLIVSKSLFFKKLLESNGLNHPEELNLFSKYNPEPCVGMLKTTVVKYIHNNKKTTTGFFFNLLVSLVRSGNPIALNLI